MRAINAQILSELEAANLKPFYLLHLNIDGNDFRYTDCDVPIARPAVESIHEEVELHTPKEFEVDKVAYSLGRIVDSINIEIEDVKALLRTYFVGGTPRGGAVTYSLVVLDSNNEIVINPVVLFSGIIDDWELDETKISIQVTNINNRWSEETLNRQSASCRWKVFKGTECQYAGGETWCDRSYARCTVLSNTDNFGGFRFLPSIVDKEIWWGSVPK